MYSFPHFEAVCCSISCSDLFLDFLLLHSSPLTYSFTNLEPVHCSMSGSNCCFLNCVQISQEVGKVVWYFHLFKNFPQFAVIHTVKGFNVVNDAEVDVFLEFSCFFYDPIVVDNLISCSSTFSKFSLNTWKFLVHQAVEA